MNVTTVGPLAIVLLVSGAIAAAGILLDRLVLPRQLRVIRVCLWRWWKRIARIEIPDLEDHTIELFFRGLAIIRLDKLFTLKWLVLTVCLSFTLTTISILIGNFLYFGNFSESMAYLIKPRFILYFPVNYVFDALTLVTTFMLLRFIHGKSWWLKLPILCVDALVAIALAIICYTAGNWIEYPTTFHYIYEFGGIEEIIGTYLALYCQESHVWGFIEWSTCEAVFGDLLRVHFDPSDFTTADTATFMFANTTLLPTLLHILLVVVLTISVMSLRFARFVPMQLFALTIHTNKSIFYYSGTFLALVNLLVSGSISVLELLEKAS